MTSAMLATEMQPAPQPYEGFERMLIAGQWREGRSERTLDDRNPYSGEVLARIPLASKGDLDDAYHAAAEAQPGWAGLLPMERAAVLLRAARIFEERKGEIVDWIIREAGGTRIKAEIEWDSARAITLEAAGFPSRLEGRILPSDVPGKESRVYRQPLGVVGVISPWNFPLHLSNRSVAPALACGNAVVLKPASDTPVTGALLLAKIYEEAGLPPGVLNTVVGSGSEIGDDFVLHPIPRLISFTGSTEVGKGIGKLAASGPMLKKVALELGGNGPLVVLDDADLDVAIRAAVFGKFLNAGEVCMSINRLVVDARVYDDFVDGFTRRVRGLKYGDPNDPQTAIGPVINQSQLDGLLDVIHQAQAAGFRQTLGGEPQGLVLPPHVFADVTNDSPVAQHEMFGPVATIIRAEGEEEALRIANGTSYGLSSSVFTRDAARGVRFACRVQAGMTHVNDAPVVDLPNSPFGGEKNSGIGRFGGEWAIHEFTTDHWITVQHEPRQYPF